MVDAKWADYSKIPYVDGGRDRTGLDCWGLVREVLHQHFNVPLLPKFGQVAAANKLGMTAGYHELAVNFRNDKPANGAIAAGFRGDCLIHVGVCIEESHQLKVLHTSSKWGPMLSSIRDFERLFETVSFHVYEVGHDNK